MIPSRTPDKDPNTAAGPRLEMFSVVRLSSETLGHRGHYQVVISLRKVLDTPSPPPSPRPLRSPARVPTANAKRAIPEVNDGCWTLVLEPAYLATSQPRRHLILSTGTDNQSLISSLLDGKRLLCA